MSETLKSVTLKSLVQTGKVTGISNLRKNTTGLYYVTLLNGSKPNNVYFSKKAGTVVDGTFSEGDSIVAFLKNSEVVQTINEEGEVRFKLTVPSSNSNYASKAELMDVFGGDEQTTEFDMSLFVSQFASQTSLAPTQG